MDSQTFLREAQHLAVDFANVAVTFHAEIRKPEEGKYPLTRFAIQTCILSLNAHVTEKPIVDLKEPGGWKATISSREVDKTIDVACVVVPKTRLIIITAYETRLFSRAPKRPPGSPDTGDEDEEG